MKIEIALEDLRKTVEEICSKLERDDREKLTVNVELITPQSENCVIVAETLKFSLSFRETWGGRDGCVTEERRCGEIFSISERQPARVSNNIVKTLVTDKKEDDDNEEIPF